MNPVFLDTSGIIAVVNTDDQWHTTAESVWQDLIQAKLPLVTTSLVLIEMGDGLSRIGYRGLAVELRDRLLASSRIEVIQTTAGDEDRAWKLFRQRHDKEWGMTDCVSMIVARDRAAREVFSTDHHFQQAGFQILLNR